MTQQGYLIISDITGYSKFVHESELEHARDSLAALLNILIDHTQSPLVISKLEGDAVFSYATEVDFCKDKPCWIWSNPRMPPSARHWSSWC